MKICLFSDIHGNGPAFRSAYTMMIEEKADAYLFLGDLCGYYFDQTEIFSLLRSLPNLMALKGNHDQMFLNILKGDDGLRASYLNTYGRSMENLLEDDTGDLNRWLSSLPETNILSEFNIKIWHGSPWDPLEGYVYPDSPLETFLSDPASLFLLGHTHYSMDRVIQNKRIVNPGSLGQPRNGRWPTYAVVELSSQEVSFRDVYYDKQVLLREIERMDNHHPYLKKHLAFNA